jgi:hypothetical protein
MTNDEGISSAGRSKWPRCQRLVAGRREGAVSYPQGARSEHGKLNAHGVQRTQRYFGEWRRRCESLAKGEAFPATK